MIFTARTHLDSVIGPYSYTAVHVKDAKIVTLTHSS